MERLINKVELKFFCDDANGEYGVAPKQTFDYNSYEKFNAFWSGIGIFHDVFEHYFEYKHKYFMKDYAMNVGGEMAAMGHMWYYQMKLGLYNKRRLNPNSIYSDGDIMRRSTSDMVQEAICYGQADFGSTLECSIPRQRPSEDSELEYQIDKFWRDSKLWSCDSNYTSEKEYSEVYKKSVTFSKIANPHRWGYRQAERYVPDNYDNRDTLYKFIDFWNEFTKNNNAEALWSIFSQLNFYVYRENDRISWKAKLIGSNGNRSFKIRGTHSIEEEM